MIRSVFLILLAVLTAVGAEQTRAKDEDSVREVAFKCLIHETAAAGEGYNVYFLSAGVTSVGDNSFKEIEERDPSDELMKRFVGHRPPVRKISDSRKTDGGGVVDKSTGKPGAIFSVDHVQWISENEAEARCAVYRGPLNGVVFKYTLSRTNNQWKITSKKLVGVS